MQEGVENALLEIKSANRTGSKKDLLRVTIYHPQAEKPYL
jgi:hypothetical protein